MWLWLFFLATGSWLNVPPLSGQTGQGASDERSVRAVFDAYKTALMAGDGRTAARLVDRDTVAYFEVLKRLALGADREEIDRRPFIDRLLVVSIRHVLDPETIEDLGLDDLIERAVREGWISRVTVDQLEMGAVTVAGDEASGEVMTTAMVAGEATSSPVEGLSYRFRREDGEWRFGFSSLVAGLNLVIAQFTEQLGTDEDELIFVLVEAFSGRKVMPEVWHRPPASSPAEPPHDWR